MSLRFSFGRNWQAFVARLTPAQLDRARTHLSGMVGEDRLAGARFLDIGCGSGLAGLAARELGATVHAFDYDPDSVACAQALRDQFRPNDPGWRIERGDVLDETYIASLGRWNVVHAWGVLHHTGDMWRAIANTARLAEPGGTVVLAIYNDQGWSSRAWRMVKQAYCSLPAPLRPLVLAPATLRLWGPTVLRDTVRGAPLRTWRRYAEDRGMSPWRDVVDWVGGYPFEVATPERIVARCGEHGLSLAHEVRRGGIGCNEFVFQATGAAALAGAILP